MKIKNYIKSKLDILKLQQKEILDKLLKKLSFSTEGNIMEYILKKYFWHFLIFFGVLLLSLISQYLPLTLKEKREKTSLDYLVPKGFVLAPIEIINGEDIINIIGKYGVVDLYAYSSQTHLPEKQAASSLKILPPETKEGRFLALIPEKEALLLFQYSNPFYAVIQNPTNKSSKIQKKKKIKPLIVIEENFL